MPRSGPLAAMRMRSRYRWAAAALGVAGIAHGLVWWIATSRILDGLPGFVAQGAAAGWVLEAGPGQRGGWPWTATVTLAHPSATHALGETRFSWMADRLVLSLRPGDPGAILAAAEGDQAVGWAGQPPLRIHAASTTLRIPFAPEMPLELEGADVDVPGPNRVTIRAGHVLGRAAGLAVTLAVGGLEFGPALAAPFDGPASVSVRAVPNLPLPAASSPAAAAAAWRAAGGTVSLPDIAVDWGPFHVTGTADGGLDAQLQPEGTAVLNVRGATEVLDAASRAGLVAASPASAARAVLGLLALASGGAPVRLAASLHDRTLTVAQFPLARVPLVEWGVP